MINLRDKLSLLTYRETCKLLGPEGERLVRAGGKYDIEINENVVLRDDLFRMNVGGVLSPSPYPLKGRSV